MDVWVELLKVRRHARHRTMKSPFTNSTFLSRPASWVCFSARSIWYALLFSPTMWQSAKVAIYRAGPPTPQPTLRTFIPG